MTLMNRLTRDPGFRRLMDMATRLSPRRSSDARSDSSSRWRPPLDVAETGEQFIIELEAPGLDPDWFDISVSNRTLHISMDEEIEREQDRAFLRTERSVQPFERQIRLPETVDAENIQAEYDRGILRIYLDKSPVARERKIDVQLKE